ncbi:5-formyltetrahydrofolate cyclo-ligase [Parvularcula sp. LCG005]|uniref:5-formyltetrahydrofolate cyclo-ligase n=1 Tax=Parvularcula sp. LCG005 TaxID=3078805 RepID=UPI002943CA6E|nr:5-formyltetrahydrofolate cyclo-ligase [Parvularcula sp. LCG005]WOI52828.1 5-formyltetrahydrofolate cyclo-ligase [Parvularcula sp. LCG005]
MVIAPIPLMDWKAVFRTRAKKARAEAASTQPDADRFAAMHFINEFAPKNASNIALYHPTGDELDTAPLAAALMEAGHAVLLPVVVKKKAPLIFRLWEPEVPLVKGKFDIPCPPDTSKEIRPDIIVVPLLGIRHDGARLGMGGGFYDRTLASLRDGGAVLAIGYGYGAQKMDRFPVDAHDQFLDGFVSEKGAERIARRR